MSKVLSRFTQQARQLSPRRLVERIAATTVSLVSIAKQAPGSAGKENKAYARLHKAFMEQMGHWARLLKRDWAEAARRDQVTRFLNQRFPATLKQLRMSATQVYELARQQVDQLTRHSAAAVSLR